MRDLLISAVSFAIIATILWGSFLLLCVVIDFLSGMGISAGFLWFTSGLAVAYCKPAAALLKLCESVYIKVHDIFWRLD
jgi:hypothetical protein